jgi:hypothetical protein
MYKNDDWSVKLKIWELFVYEKYHHDNCWYSGIFRIETNRGGRALIGISKLIHLKDRETCAIDDSIKWVLTLDFLFIRFRLFKKKGTPEILRYI